MNNQKPRKQEPCRPNAEAGKAITSELGENVVFVEQDVTQLASWPKVVDEVVARWRDRLDRIYDNCIAKFSALYKGQVLDDGAIVAGLVRLESAEVLPYPEPGGFLRKAVFALLAERAAQVTSEGDRLRRLLRIAIGTQVPVAA